MFKGSFGIWFLRVKVAFFKVKLRHGVANLLLYFLPFSNSELHQSDLQDFDVFLRPARTQRVVVQTFGVGDLGAYARDRG